MDCGGESGGNADKAGRWADGSTRNECDFVRETERGIVGRERGGGGCAVYGFGGNAFEPYGDDEFVGKCSSSADLAS